MEKVIDTTQFPERIRALIEYCGQWHNQEAGTKAKAHLEIALKELEREPLPYWSLVGEAVCAAANVEQAEVRQLSVVAFGDFYNGSSDTLFSDLVGAQKRLPNQSRIIPLMKDVAVVDAVTRKLLGDVTPKGSG